MTVSYKEMDVSLLRRKALSSLLDTLDKIGVKKHIFLDRALAKSINNLTPFSLLRDHGVDKVFWLDEPTEVVISTPVVNSPSSPPRLINGVRNIVFLVRGRVKDAHIIAQHVQQLLSLRALADTDVSIICAPQVGKAFQQALEDLGILGDVQVYCWPLFLLDLEPDVLSMEYGKSCIKELYLDRVITPVYQSALAIHHLQEQFPVQLRFTHVLAKGRFAKQTVDVYERIRSEFLAELPPRERLMRGEIDTGVYGTVNSPTPHVRRRCELIVLERAVDFVTPLMSQLTYEGLVDEFFGITAGQTELPAHIFADEEGESGNGGSSAEPRQSEERKTRKLALSASDALFHTLRDLNLADVGPTLNQEARKLQAAFEARHEAQTVSAIREFVGRLGDLKEAQHSLKIHTNLAEELLRHAAPPDGAPTYGSHVFSTSLELQQNLLADTMDPQRRLEMLLELIYREAPLPQVLRLLCLESLTHNGLRARDYEHLKREICATYGAQHVLTIQNLHAMGLLYSKNTPPPTIHVRDWPTLLQRLRLVADDTEDLGTERNGPTPDPRDALAHVYSGYVPLSVRLLQAVYDKSVVRGAAGGARAGLVGWKGLDSVLKCLNGEQVDDVRVTQVKKSSSAAPGAKPSTEKEPSEADGSLCVLFFLGGVTFGELAAIRLYAEKLQRHQTEQRRFLIVTTGMVNGSEIVESAIV